MHLQSTIQIERLVLSPRHSHFGRHGLGADAAPQRQVPEVRCVAGSGLEGDRFFDCRPGYTGQITFFALEVFDALLEALGCGSRAPMVTRRNMLTRGLDLDRLIGRDFELQGVRFFGCEECRPCYWMDTAIGPGAEQWMRGRGGLRAQIRTSGPLRCGEARLHVL